MPVAATPRRAAALTLAALMLAAPLRAAAEDAQTEDDQAKGAWSHQIVYTADVTGVIGGAPSKAGRYLDNLDVIVDGDLEKAFGWSGAKAHLYLLGNTGGRPNEDLIGTLQGVDNIEVSRPRTRLFELWLEQGFAGGAASLRAGLYDLNSEFYATDASALLLAPPFGVGSELGASGPHGPSIFPSTSLAVRFRVGKDTGPYAQAAAFNAEAGTLGDPQGIDTSFRAGGLYIAEAGLGGSTHLAAGAWAYGRRQNDLRALAADGGPARARAWGAYLLAEQPLATRGAQTLRGFLRAGISDDDTTPFEGGWQAGLRLDGVFAARPKSGLSIGLQQGFVTAKARANGRDAGRDLGGAESALEITYTDSLGRLSIQPDLQFVRHPGGDRARDTAVVGALRLTLDFS